MTENASVGGGVAARGGGGTVDRHLLILSLTKAGMGRMGTVDVLFGNSNVRGRVWSPP